MSKWFVCQNELVQGPYSTEEIKQKSQSGELGPEHLIWGKPQEEWRTVAWWQENLTQLLERVHVTENEQVWHYLFNEQSHGPMSRQELIEDVSKLEQKAEVFVWTKGMKSWVAIFECLDLMDDAGVSRRKHPRADIQASVIVTLGEQDYIGSLKTVSAAGCGIQGVKNIKPGQIIDLTLKSEHFHKPINAKAEVRYISDTGFAGLQFVTINMEEKAAIIDYVRESILRSSEAA